MTPVITSNLNQRVQAPLNQVFEAFTSATRLCEWLGYDAQLEANPGGRFYLYWREPAFYVMGEYVALQNQQLIQIKLYEAEQPANLLSIAFSESDGQTEVSLSSALALSSTLHTLLQRGLANLKSTYESGFTLETLERPMLGVLIGGNLTPENAATYQVPLDSGVVLWGTVPGLSAEAAGLQQNDVLIGLAGQEVRTFADIGPIVRLYKAGQSIEAVYFRKSQRHVVSMQLKARPQPAYPQNPLQLAQQFTAANIELLQELQTLMQSATPQQSAHKAAPERWSANEVIAHLILTERDQQTFIAGLVENNELETFTSNQHARVTAVAQRYGHTAALIQALHDTMQETHHLLAALPPSFLQRKASVVRLQLAAEANPFHTRHHFGQIQRALEAASATS